MGESNNEQGLTSLDQYGRGNKDPNTGIWDWYEEVPREVIAPTGTPVSWPAILDQWGLIEALFHSTYGVDLSKVHRTESWRWFVIRLRLLLRTENPLSRHFAPDEEPTEAP